MSVTLRYPALIKHFSLKLGLSHTKSPVTTFSQEDLRQTGQGTQVEITYCASQRHKTCVIPSLCLWPFSVNPGDNPHSHSLPLGGSEPGRVQIQEAIADPFIDDPFK